MLYLIVVQTAIVFLAWYNAVDKLGVEPADLFNGVMPVASLAAVSAVGTGTVSGLQAAGAQQWRPGFSSASPARARQDGRCALGRERGGRLGTWPRQTRGTAPVSHISRDTGAVAGRQLHRVRDAGLVEP